jgi:small-conductance mechanosensitive channel
MAVLLCASLGLPLIPDGVVALAIKKTATLCWIGSMAWLAISLSAAAENFLSQRYDLAQPDNLKARSFLTRIKVLQRITAVLILLLAVGAMFLSFERFRSLGISLLASAGLAGVILGFSAQKVLGLVLAGVQVAWTQPIRIDDVVVVEGEWGRVEEITLTYVVVRIWDSRRLVLPISYFLEKPFQNWTRTSSDILGSVLLQLDYTAPVDAIRGELTRICREEGAPLWNGEACGVQVTNADERVLEVRLLVSADNSSKAWDLRCLVREKMVEFLRREHPAALPALRWREAPMHKNQTPAE